MKAVLLTLWASDPYAQHLCNVESHRDQDDVESDLCAAAAKIANGEKVWIHHDTDAIQAVIHMVRYTLKLQNWREILQAPAIPSCVDTRNDIKRGAGSGSSPHSRTPSRPRSSSGPRSSKGRGRSETEQMQAMMQLLERGNANDSGSDSVE